MNNLKQLRFRQVHLDFHTSPDIGGIGEAFDRKAWQETLKAAHVTATNSDSAITVETGATVSEHVVSKVNKLYLKGDVQFFSREDPTDLGTQTASGGGCSFGTADANCVVVFSATSTDWMPAASMFFKQGEEIAVPSAANLDDGTTVRAWKYNIGVE